MLEFSHPCKNNVVEKNPVNTYFFSHGFYLKLEISNRESQAENKYPVWIFTVTPGRSAHEVILRSMVGKKNRHKITSSRF